MIKCTINNTPIEVKKGTTILEAFKKWEKSIAHYCWHPGLSVAGVCRLCMVEIEGIPKLQIACNTEIKEGMKITNQSKKVKLAVKWGLEFHLINHPLDCPICDQAGECELQEQYMEFGKYNPKMVENKVKKEKAINLGSKIVLDSERCILCSRCVRFTNEVSKTNELGIFNRGDKSEIGIFKNKPLNNNYTLNTVDICPVGALTSKDFRFRQRVWYLKTADSICTGCSTGCNIKIDYNEKGLFRVRPKYNKEVNGHWMCDEGRSLYNITNKKERLLYATTPLSQSMNTLKALKQIKKNFINNPVSKSALILTAQYTLEEYEDLISFFLKNLGDKNSIYYWKNNPDTHKNFDGLLLRGDKNPNTQGLLQILNKHEITNSWDNLQIQLKQKEIETLWIMGPENQKVYPKINQYIKYFTSYSKNIIWWTANPLTISPEESQKIWQIPTKTFFEKSGTFINFANISQKINKISLYAPNALSICESLKILNGNSLPDLPYFTTTPTELNHPINTNTKNTL